MPSSSSQAQSVYPNSSVAPQLVRGQVAVLAGDDIHVRVAEGRRTCVKAASCLMLPGAGDEVLVALEGEDAGWVLAVLRRASDGPAHLSVGDDATLSAKGTLRIVAGDELALTSPERVRVTTRAVELSAKAADAAIDRVRVVGANLQSHYDQVRTLANTMDQMATRVVQRIKRRYQFVEESDQLRASELDVRARELLSLQGKQTVVTAEQVVKVDGDQVHVG